MKLILCGDICPTELTRPAFDAGDVAALLGGAEDIIKSGDFALANLECALTDGDKAIRKLGALLKGRPQDAAVLAGCGFTHMGLSNNHTLDYGVAGMRDTVRSVQEAGMIPFGFGENDQDSRRCFWKRTACGWGSWPCASTNTPTPCGTSSGPIPSTPSTPWRISRWPRRRPTG